MSLLYANSIDLTAFSTFFGKPKKQSAQSALGKRGKNVKYCIQNNIHSCFLEYHHFEDISYKRRSQQINDSEEFNNATESDAISRVELFSSTCALEAPSILSEVERLEDAVRKGDMTARIKITQLLPFYSYMSQYRNLHHVLRNIDSSNLPYIDMQHMPDITIFLHQCIIPTQYYEDDIVILLRSCIPFFQNPRRVKQDHAWPLDNDKTLVILIQCCVPSLLSIYPSICIKDVSFQCRAKIMIFLRNLLTGTFEMRNIFYTNNKVLIKMCLIEYVYYFIHHISPLPATPYIKSIDIQTMATNIFNIGQQLRVEINSEFDKNPCIDVVDLFANVRHKCLVMYERTSRYNKNMFLGSLGQGVDTTACFRLRSVKTKKQNILNILKTSLHNLSGVPYTGCFQIFDNYCQRKNIATGHINVLWDTMQRIKIYELSLDLFQTQKNEIEHQKNASSEIHMRRQSNLLVCISCIEKNIFPTFRYNVRKNEYKCTRCDIKGSVFEVNVMGRLIVVCNIPLVFSTCCRSIVVYSGTGNEFHSSEVPCKCIKWTNNTNTSTFNQLISSMSVSQYVFQVENVKPTELKTATWQFMRGRMDGNIQPSFDQLHTERLRTYPCCLCPNSTCANQKYFLLDIYSRAMICVNVCMKHSIPDHARKKIASVQDFLAYVKMK